MLSFRDVKAIKDIHGFGSPCQKHEMYKLQNGEGHMNILNVIDREDHNQKRRMLSHAFSTKNLESWEFNITDKVEKLVAQFDRRAHSPAWKNGPSQPNNSMIDVRYWFNLFTVDAIADIALSERLGMLESGSDVVKFGGPGEEDSAHRFIEDMHEAARVKWKIIGTLDWHYVFKHVSSFLSSRCRSQWDCGRNVSQIVSHLAGKRLRRHENDESIYNFLSFLIQDKAGKPRNLDMGELRQKRASCVSHSFRKRHEHRLIRTSVVDAGSKTTAIALTHLLYYLLKNPDCFVKLRKEVSGAIAGDKVAPYAKVRFLPYLKACIEKSLRLSPPLPRGLERVTPPAGAISWASLFLGMWVSRFLHMSPIGTRICSQNQKPSYQRDGLRMKTLCGWSCLYWENITMIEQQILVATLVHRYDFSLPSPNWTLHNEEAFNLWPVELPVKIWKRDLET